MSARDVIKAVVCFYRLDSDAEFERLRSQIPINNDLQTDSRVLMKKHLVAFLDFLGLKELATKYGVGNCELKLQDVKRNWSKNQTAFRIFTDGQCPTQICMKFYILL